ncbi:hypothetical protein DH2020_002990 [Rehmannia glutinosa]|uniref:Reverse transcriptase Ty1/copia-type domain-containing protein n=1 Tax=Rehmannia glutinosa TaxID=99300 RepID=A0ABR0XVL1_REHGL
MNPPEGYTKAGPGEVCHLKRSLCGLKQASRQWHVEFCSKLLDFGFVQSAFDHCLFIKKSDHSYLALLVYVDDVLITGSHDEDIAVVKAYLHKAFTIKDMGSAKYFLGLEIARTASGTYINQRKYIMDILEDTGSPLSSPDRFRRLVGRLLYLNLTRPDIAYGVQQLSQFVNAPCTEHWDAALHLVRYLKGNPSLGLFYSASSSCSLTAYCDADWGACVDTRRSLTGYCVFLGDCLISWKTKKQQTVSRSSAEAEHRSLSMTVYELLWLSYIAADFQRTKHLEIDCHLVRDQFKAGFVLPQKVSSQFQLADMFTKALGPSAFHKLIGYLGLQDVHHVPS